MTGPTKRSRPSRPWPRTTKAQTLALLAPKVKLSRVAELCVATLADLRKNEASLVTRIQSALKGRLLAVRSSHSSEDAEGSSLAGKYASILHVPRRDAKALGEALRKVASSYGTKARGSEEILIQNMVEDVTMAGVVFTREILSGAPYYVISLETGGRTDGITSGRAGGALYLSRLEKPPKAWSRLVASLREVETILGSDALDIELAISKGGQIHLLQARPLVQASKGRPACNDARLAQRLRGALDLVRAISAPQPHLVGASTILGNMPDWNPAEILGAHPRPLDLSLYRHLVTDEIWQRARRSLGYQNVAPAPLLRTILGRPTIDVRLSLNSFLPATLPLATSEALVEEALRRLALHPELQDKIEFELTVTCHRFDMETHLAKVAGSLSGPQRKHVARSHLHLTREILRSFPSHLRSDLASITELGSRRQRLLVSKPSDLLESLHGVRMLLDDCRELGTLPFARLARLAFIGKTLLVSAQEAGLVPRSEVEGFLQGLSTVAGHMEEDSLLLAGGKLARADFLERYGHLRPGTYDITSPTYADDPSRLGSAPARQGAAPKGLSADSLSRLDKASRSQLDVGAFELLTFIKLSLEAREDAKFEFTRNLSAALDLLVRALKKEGFTREDIAHLELGDLEIDRLAADPSGLQSIRDLAESRRRRHAEEALLRVPPVICGPGDLVSVQHPASVPNFVASKRVKAAPLLLEGTSKTSPKGRIVLIRSADPGWDWIFTHGPAGLVTEYGGVASHMAIRCAEFGLSAAIGCGSEIFNRLLRLKMIDLDPATAYVGESRP
ncbi:MAG: PEP/pyruvate-binding domain-containing protein [Planctomycetota bacterium]